VVFARDSKSIRSCPRPAVKCDVRHRVSRHRGPIKLNRMGIGNLQAVQLSHLAKAPSITTLSLELRSNLIEFQGIGALVARLRRSCSLRTICLDLDRNPIDDLCLLQLATLMDTPSQLQTLVLKLGNPSKCIQQPIPMYQILDRLKQHPRMVSPSLVSWGASDDDSDVNGDDSDSGSRPGSVFTEESHGVPESRQVRYWWKATGLPEVGKREFWEPGGPNVPNIYGNAPYNTTTEQVQSDRESNKLL
jgi:hypothetical protein